MATILLVEDDPHIADCLSTILLAAGHLCVRAANAAEARSLLETDPEIALIVLDYNLGENSESGQSFLQTLRTTPRFESVPVIICSAEAHPHVISSFLPLRISGFLRKPFRRDRLLADVANALGTPENFAEDATTAPRQR